MKNALVPPCSILPGYFILLPSQQILTFLYKFKSAVVPYWISLSAMARNANNEAESQTSSVISVGDVSTTTVPDDISLSIQRATSVLSKIYTELFFKPKNEFMSELSNNCDVTELRYVSDMIMLARM